MRLEEIHISAISPDYAAQPRTPAGVISASLEQRNRFRFRKYSFRLIDKRRLSVNVDGIFMHRSDYEFDIGILNPEPKRLVSINWGYISAFFILSVTAILVARSQLFPDPFMVSSLLAGVATMFLVVAAYSCRNRLVFYSRNGFVPLVVLLYRNPSDARVRAFTNCLTEQIRYIQSRYGSRGEMLRDDLKEHRRLMEHGLISEKHYDWIRQYILCLHSKAPGARFNESPKGDALD
jgi:hypothetical protein